MKSIAERGPRRVESRQNARIKELRAGLARGAKTPHRRRRPAPGAGSGEERPEAAYRVCAEGNEALLQHFAVGDAEVLIVTEEVFLSATMTEHPQGIAALVEAPEFTVEAMFQTELPWW